MLETPTSGTIIFDGEEITAKGCRLDEVRRKMGMVFQSFNLFNHMNVIENIMYAPRKVLGLTDAEAYERGMDLLKTVGLANRANAYPDELSGGQLNDAPFLAGRSSITSCVLKIVFYQILIFYFQFTYLHGSIIT